LSEPVGAAWSSTPITLGKAVRSEGVTPRARDAEPCSRRASRWQRTPKGSARVAIATAILAFLFGRMPAAEVLQSVAGASVGGLLGAVLVVFLLQLVAADRLRRLAKAYYVGLSSWALFKINLATLFYGLCLPAGNVTGFIARLCMMSASPKQYLDVALALSCDRVIATVALCVVGIGFWLLAWPVGAWHVLAVMLVVLVGVSLLQAAFLARLPLPSPFPWPAKLDFLRQALHRSQSVPCATLVAAFALGVVIHLLGTLAYGLVAWTLQLDLSLATIGWTRAAAMLAALLPISVAGLGVREGVLVLLLTPYAVPAPDALAFGLLAFAVTVLAPGIAGALIEVDRLLVRPLFCRGAAARLVRGKTGCAIVRRIDT
jgi:glycosyltransferase 2 family protein